MCNLVGVSFSNHQRVFRVEVLLHSPEECCTVGSWTNHDDHGMVCSHR